MSNIQQEGGLAFPLKTDYTVYAGMTLRDYFAAAAMQGILANNAKDYDDADMAEYSYVLADYMLATREKKEAQK
jgi:hypothetical protein